jgi:biopolymer transport protein ExbD/biopolymer transport protein TolR
MAMDLTAGGKAGKKRGAKPEMNVTPLVDVVLVLLIIFMVITPLLSKQFWIFLPLKPEATAPPPPPDPNHPAIVVSVDGAGVIRINSDEVQLADLGTRLHRILAARGDRTIFFDAANDAPFERAVAALDAARGGGATTIAVATETLAPH